MSSEKTISSTANSLRHRTPCSIMFHCPRDTWRSSLQSCLSLTLESSRRQRLRVSCLFPIPWSIATPRDRDPSCLASLPSRIVSLAMASPIQSSKVNMDPFASRVNSLRSSRSLPGDRDRVTFSGSVSSAGCEGPASSSSFTMGIFFSEQGRLLPA